MSRIESLGKCLVERYGLTRKDAESFVSEMFAVIRDSLEKERVVKVKGLGTFKLADMNPRESVDVNTGERILIEGRAKVSFTPENAVRDRINSPFAQFETVDIGEDVDFSAIDDKYSAAEEPEEQPEREPEKVPEPEITQEKPEEVQPEPEPEPVEAETLPADNAVEAAPIEPEKVAEPVEKVAEPVEETAPEQAGETKETPVVHNPFCEELIREGITHSRKIIRLLYVMLGLIVVAMLVGALYLGYRLGAGVQERKADYAKEPAAKVVAVKPKPVVKKPVAAVEKADTVQKQEKTVLVPEQKADSVELMQAEYDKDVRVRTGAYRIMGLFKTVTVQEGQTFEGICHAYFGDGMECYVEVFNGGKRDYKTGDEIKIPILKLKKRMNR